MENVTDTEMKNFDYKAVEIPIYPNSYTEDLIQLQGGNAGNTSNTIMQQFNRTPNLNSDDEKFKKY